jgi:hypothetical protein
VLHVVTVITQDYLARGRTYLDSCVRLSARLWCLTLGWESAPALAAGCPHLTFRHLPRHPSDSFGMSQWGRALDALPEVAEGDVLIQVDADVVVQRDFTHGERARLKAYDGMALGAGPNAGPGDNLWDESWRIRLVGWRDGGEAVLRGIPCSNGGVLAARPAAWRRLRTAYEVRCQDFYRLTQHRSRCQWLLNFCLREAGLRVDVLPGEVHSHGHFRTPAGVSFGPGGEVYCWGRVVLFAHALAVPRS